MRFQAFDWDQQNIDHVARHGVEPGEVEAACRGAALVLRGREARYLAYGQTAAGRYLLIVFRVLDQGRIRIITARDMTERERRMYRERRR